MSSKPGPFDLGQTIGEAVTLHRQGRLDEAEKLYNRVLKAQRDNFDALHLLGMLNHQRGKAGEAFRLINAALKAQPRSADALSNLALVLHALKRSDEALAQIDKALAFEPRHLDALNNRGNVLLDLKRPIEALAAFDVVLAAEARHLQARVNHGNALTELGRHHEALADYDAALALAPGHPLALYNRGNALHALGRDPDAVAAYDAALRAAPNHPKTWLNRGMAQAALNRHQDALASYGKVVALQPDNADAHFSAALSLLTLGDYPRGFAEYEWRWKRTGMSARKEFRRPPWLGDAPLAGKTLLLHAEQGLGDTIMFVRYVPLLARAGAKVVLEVQPELKELLSGLEGAVAVIARGEPLPAYDHHCPLGSLPLVLRTEASTVPAELPYLKAPAERVAKWRERLKGVRSPYILLAWSGRATHVNDRNRSLAFSQLDEILSLAPLHASLISVQRDLRPADAELLVREPRVLDVGPELADFTDTAALMEIANFTICVDTAVAHLAGALGRAAFVMLPFQPDWRWALSGQEASWYPKKHVLFRQSAPGDWDSVLREVRSSAIQVARQ